SGNPMWEDDIRVFEKTRCEEIGKQAKLAFAEDDADSLESLLGELEGTRWLEAPAARVANYVHSVAKRAQQKKLRQDLAILQRKWEAGWDAGDVIKGRELRRAWESLSKEAELPREDPLFAAAAPTLHWLANEDQRQAVDRKYSYAEKSLEQALDERLPSDRLH